MISKAFYGRLKDLKHSQATAHSSYVEFLDKELDRAIGQKVNAKVTRENVQYSYHRCGSKV